jgi:hypothetical protein
MKSIYRLLGIGLIIGIVTLAVSSCVFAWNMCASVPGGGDGQCMIAAITGPGMIGMQVSGIDVQNVSTDFLNQNMFSFKYYGQTTIAFLLSGVLLALIVGIPTNLIMNKSRK